MKNKSCLSELDLILHYYGELPSNSEKIRHIAECNQCGMRFSALNHDLAKLPELPYKHNPASGTRMAARVSEQLNGRYRYWKPTMGASALAIFALVITISVWSPQSNLVQTTEFKTPPLAAINLTEDSPDIEFLEELELLQELELLSQIEGV